MKHRFLLLFGLVILAGTLLACGGSDNTGTSTGSSQSTSQPTQSPAKHFKIGDTVKVGDSWQVIVNSVKTDTGGTYSSLKSGDIYLLIDVSMTNISNKEQTTSSIGDWNLQGTDGQKYDSSFFSGAPSAPDGKVEAGSPSKGTLAYEVPSSVKTFQLAFAPSMFSGGQTIWDLSVS